jgi:hypothetical protein
MLRLILVDLVLSVFVGKTASYPFYHQSDASFQFHVID